MCRLLGVIANKSVDLEFSLERFKKFAIENHDGWGIGWYDENATAKVFKQGISAVDKESGFPILSKEVRSNIIIAHVRKGTNWEPSIKNSHPFKHKNWIFAHNGCVNKKLLLNLLNGYHRSSIIGETDSEVYFHWILQCIEKEGDVVNGVMKAIEEIRKSSYTGLNFLLSDGKKLYAYRYSSRSEDYYTLFILKRAPTISGTLELQPKETAALIRSKSLKGERAILICSEGLTQEDWESVRLGSLITIDSNLNLREEISI